MTLGMHRFDLTVNDGRDGTAGDTTDVTVVDSTPPDVTAAMILIGSDDDDEALFRVEFSCTDIVDTDVIPTATLNGIPVTNGQLVNLEFDDETEVGADDGVLEFEAPAFTFAVNCSDASGNEGSAIIAFPPFVDDDDD